MEVRELALKLIGKVKPITDKAGITGELLPLISNSEKAVKATGECDATGIAYSLMGIGKATDEIEKLLQKAMEEGKISFSERVDTEFEIRDFRDKILEKSISNLKSCIKG